MTEQGGLLSLVVTKACPRQAEKLPLILKHSKTKLPFCVLTRSSVTIHMGFPE